MPFVQVDPKSASPTDRAIAAAQTKLRATTRTPNAQLAWRRPSCRRPARPPTPRSTRRPTRSSTAWPSEAPDDPRVLVAQGTLLAGPPPLRRGPRGRPPGARGGAGQRGRVRGRRRRQQRARALRRGGRGDPAHGGRPARPGQPQPGVLRPRAPRRPRRRDRGDEPGRHRHRRVVAARTSPTCRCCSATCSLTRGDLDEAVAAYDAAEQAFPDLPAATAGRARVLVAQGRVRPGGRPARGAGRGAAAARVRHRPRRRAAPPPGTERARPRPTSSSR